MKPSQWRDLTIGKSYNIDGAYGAQCWDYFAYFVNYFNLNLSTYCSLTGYVCDLWRLRNVYGYSEAFEFILDPNELKPGDWCIWDRGSSHPSSHIAMYILDSKGNPVELGQNQGSVYVTEKSTTWDILGAFRFRGWGEIPIGASDIAINGSSYSLYRQRPGEMAVVLSAGMNKLASIRGLDADVYVMAKATGANYFQMKADQDDPYGTTYGDLSAPLNDVWTEVPNQETTLYFDIETGAFGDCTGIHVNPGHNVFSPSVVYPANGNYQYARMVGINHVNNVSRYTFMIRFKDGTYAIGISNYDETPKKIAEDFKGFIPEELDSISFLDGGGSAQMGRWNNDRFEYVRDTGRECPSAVAIINTKPITEPEAEPETGEMPGDTEKDEEIIMPEEKPAEQPEKVEEWKDPETGTEESTVAIIAKRFFSVKSIVTLSLTAIFCILSYNKTISTEQFMSIFTMCISFFFGYSFEKKTNGNGGSGT